MLKLAIVVVCFSLCGAGTFIVSTPRDEQSQQKTNVMPVKNRQLYQTELDSGLSCYRCFGIVTRNRLVSGASGFSCRSSKWAGIRKISPGVRLALAQLRFPVRQQTIANCPSGAASRASSRFHFRISNERSLISKSPSDWISCGCTSSKSMH